MQTTFSISSVKVNLGAEKKFNITGKLTVFQLNNLPSFYQLKWKAAAFKLTLWFQNANVQL